MMSMMTMIMTSSSRLSGNQPERRQQQQQESGLRKLLILKSKHRTSNCGDSTNATTTINTNTFKSDRSQKIICKPKANKSSPTTTNITPRRRRNNYYKNNNNQLASLILLALIYLLNGASHFQWNLQQQVGVLAFNIDTQSAIVHQGPADSHFGFSVALHRDRGTNWVLVGAPTAQTDQLKTKESGAVYRCTPNNSKACQQIPFDPNGSSVMQLGTEVRQSDEKSHQWFGASLQSATENGSILACASRYVYYSTNLKRRDPVGTCWVSRGSFTGFLEYSPCRINDQWGHHHLGSCQAGFSSAISKDGGRIWIGAPGSHVWQGQVFQHNLKSSLSNSTSDTNPHSEDDSYLGYSLALGRFSGNSPLAEQDLAIGVPRGADLSGKVMIVDGISMRNSRNITGEQMGAYFGYSIASSDVNGDGLDDLIIGAPLYYNQTVSHKEAHFERGRVYVALQNMRNEFNIANRLDGHKNRARFGTAIANCGDLNRDGFQDVAIGAPYDGPESRGAVYIYMGRKTGLADEPDQVIYAEQVRGEAQNLRSFGFALSAGLDMDGNTYPDLLVGDYAADRAILLKTRPVVNVTASLVFQPEYFNLDDKTCLLPNNPGVSVSCITIQYCIKYTGINVDNRTQFQFDIKLDSENKKAPRLFFLNNQDKNEDRNSTYLTKNVEQCRPFKAFIMREIRDKLTPLKVEIDYNLVDYDSYDYATSLPKLKPILNRSVPNKLSKVATIQKNCGYDNVCVPDLKLNMTSNIDQYTIGSKEKLILDVTVKNNAEDAYESMFYLTMPMTINYINYNKTRSDYPTCSGAKPDQDGVNKLVCDLGNPQVRNDVVKFSIIMEPAKGMFTEPDFTFLATVNSTNPELESTREDNQVEVGIPIRVDTNLVISGSSRPTSVDHNLTRSVQVNSVSNKTKVVETDVGQEVFHVYQLLNKGPSTINDIALTIFWPSKTEGGKDLLYLVDEPITNDKVKCKPAAEKINPYDLKYQRGNSMAVANSDRLAAQQQSNAITSDQSSSNIRYKRQATTSSQAAAGDQSATKAITTTTVDNSILQQLQMSRGPNQWTLFECNVFNLGYNEAATIQIRSRLYEETLNYLSQKEYDISSRLVAQIKSLPYNVSSQTMQPYHYKVVTQVHLTGVNVQDLLPWWLILLSILLGILLLILLICFFKYLGFFDRKRPPKGAEREPLTPTMWNDYQYTPGDTAL